MNCGFCAKPFEENRGQPACRSCPVGSGCGLIRCPHCGYENPGTPGWIAFLRRKLGGQGDYDAGAIDRMDLPVVQPRAKEARP